MSVEKTINKVTTGHDEFSWVTGLPEHPARLRLGGGITKNLGNFESARFDVSLDMPCHPDRLAETYERMSALIDARLQDEMDRAGV